MKGGKAEVESQKDVDELGWKENNRTRKEGKKHIVEFKPIKERRIVSGIEAGTGRGMNENRDRT